MDDGSRGLNSQSSPESSSLAGPSTSRQNEQVNEEGEPFWKFYRKHTPSPDSDRDSDASQESSDGSVQWEKNFIGKLVKVKKHSCRQQKASENERTTPTNEDRVGSPTNSQVSSTRSSVEDLHMSHLPEYEDTRQELHYESHQFGEVNRPGTSGVMEPQPGCSNNSNVSSTCGANQLRGPKQLRPNIGTEDHTCGELNLGYVSRWMKEPPGSPSHCEVSSSSWGSDSDDGLTGPHEQERERQNQASRQQALTNCDIIVAGTSQESEKMIESPINCKVSSSCETDSDTSGYSKLCLRVSEDIGEDDTDHSSGKEKRNKSHETSAYRKAGVRAHTNVKHKRSRSVESVCDEVPTHTPSLSPHIKKRRSFSHPRYLASCTQLDSNKPSHRHQQWTRDFPYRHRPARLRSQSPKERVGRWRRSPSPMDPCRRLRSRSVLSIRDTQCVTGRKRRSKSCDTYSKSKQSHESKKHSPFKGMESVSKAPSKRRSRSSRRRWLKSANLLRRHKSSSSNRDKSILHMIPSNSQSLSVRNSSSTHKFQGEHSVHESKCALVVRSQVNEEQLTSRTRRSFSRSKSIASTDQQESVEEKVPRKISHSMSGVHVDSSEKEEPREERTEHMRRQSVFLNTSKLYKCHELSQEPAFGCKPSVPVSRYRSTADSSKYKQLSSEQSPFKNMCSITHGSSTRYLHSAPVNALRRNTRSHRSRELSEELFTSTSGHSVPVNTSRRQSHLNKFKEIQGDQSTFSNVHALLMKSSEDVHLIKDKKLSDDHVVDSSCLMSGITSERHTESNKSQKLSEDMLDLRKFKGFPEEEVPLNSNLSLPAIVSESCEYVISTQAVHQVQSSSKTRCSGSVLIDGTLSSLNEVKMASELLGSSDSKHLSHSLSRKQKLSNEVCQSEDTPFTSRNLVSFFSGSCGKQTESYIAESRLVEKYPSHNRRPQVRRTCVGCENREHHSKRRVPGKFKQCAEPVQSIPQSKREEVSKTKSHPCQTGTYNSHLQLGHSSTVSESAAANKTPHGERCDNFSVPKRKRQSVLYSPLSKKKSYTKIPGKNSSLFKDASEVYDATSSDDIMVKCSTQDRICCKKDNALQELSMRMTKPCSVVLKNLELSTLYDYYVNRLYKFVFPPFPHVTSVTKVSDFCLPQDYMNKVGEKKSS